MDSGDFSTFDWSNVQAVDEDWRVQADGYQWQHQVFYRGAHWMNDASSFKLIARDANGYQLETQTVQAGRDTLWKSSDDFLERRFVARVLSGNCMAENDCSNAGAFHLAEGFIQLRVNLHAHDSFDLPSNTASLEVKWSEAPGKIWQVPIVHDAPGNTGYGFTLDLEEVSPPSRGYYLPGEQVPIRMTYKDGSGTPLFASGAMPSYGDAIGWAPSAQGLRYLVFDGLPQLYWVHKPVQGAMETFLAGPVHKMTSVATTPITPASLFQNEIVAASHSIDGYSSVIQETPITPVMFGCLFGFLPGACDFPTPDVFTFTVPADAESGTYVTGTKARRYWQGEPMLAAASLYVQVGSPNVTTFPGFNVPGVGACGSCHTGAASLPRAWHGFAGVKKVGAQCLACHTDGYYFEPDAGMTRRLVDLHEWSNRIDPP
jgi:hypothetical protein